MIATAEQEGVELSMPFTANPFSRRFSSPIDLLLHIYSGKWGIRTLGGGNPLMFSRQAP